MTTKDYETFSDPCTKVRLTCSQWMEKEGCSVTIQTQNLSRLAHDILLRKKENPTWIQWDEEKWHYTGAGYNGSERRRKERVALYILTLDAINFCFWPNKNAASKDINPLEYEHLAMSLKHLAEADQESADSTESHTCESSYAFSPENLSKLTPESLNATLQPHLKELYLDNIEKRTQLLAEVGEGLKKSFNGSAMELIEAANKDACVLVELILQNFPGFRDIVPSREDFPTIFFLKRAQIFVGDINAALNLNLKNMDKLTTFADYRVPQILRHFDILKYQPHLETIVDEGSEIPVRSKDELSIRAATVVAVENLVEHLNDRSKGEEPFTAVTVDWYLWQVGEKMHQDGLLKPFHKVRTQFY
ncbi:unnamed protein product [Cylindrotheca closterium]|uniref:Queuosine 5'-phosphate N-glycosylase/hydrolase n=1 Tax=Cylindrotheca closterium TaxID=2856 RepID=A0AAD2FZS6_9STRA|nr:unnamed protein product [Cylindrotheca closterium]